MLDTFSFEDLGEVSASKNGELLHLSTHQGGRVGVRPTGAGQAGQAAQLIGRYLSESAQAQCDYARALADFSSRDESALALSKGDVVAVLPKRDAYTEKVIDGDDENAAVALAVDVDDVVMATYSYCCFYVGSRYSIKMIKTFSSGLAVRHQGRAVRSVPVRLCREDVSEVGQEGDEGHRQGDAIRPGARERGG